MSFIRVRHTDEAEGNAYFQYISFGPVFKIDLVDSIKKKLGNEQLTHEVALKILREIKWETSIRSFMTNGVVLVVTGLSMVFMGALLPKGWVALQVLRVALGIIGGAVAGLGLAGYFRPAYQAYSHLNFEAGRLIHELENHPQLNLELPTQD